jgi:hypothetical protein
MLSDGSAEFTAMKSPWLSGGITWAVCTYLAAVVGPFATFNVFSFAERLIYWGWLIGMAFVLGLVVRRVTLRVFGRDDLGVDLVGAVIHAGILGVLVWVVNLRVYGFDVGGVWWVIYHVGIGLGVCVVIALLREKLRRMSKAALIAPGREEGAVRDHAVARPAFLHRMEDPPIGRVTRVSADNHYLDIFTHAGRGRIMMRFRDALEELEDLPGHRIHRSHWVAEEVLVRVRAEGRRHVAELACGTELPVSKAHLDRLREAGYVD